MNERVDESSSSSETSDGDELAERTGDADGHADDADDVLLLVVVVDEISSRFESDVSC